MKNLNFLKLFLSILICFIAAGIGSYFTTPSIGGWYSSLNKPFFNPPNWIFGPVWTLLYLMMGISLYVISNLKLKNKKNAIKYFFLQLICNVLWSVAFFGFHSPLYAFLLIAILWFFIFKTIKEFSKLSKTAGYLLYPYLAWVSFASILNLSIVLLN